MHQEIFRRAMAQSAAMNPEPHSIHASAVLVGSYALLIRGPSGSGKSRLALALLQAADTGVLAFARLVADDRVLCRATHGRLLAQPAPRLEGLLEVRGLGIRRLPYESVAVVGAIVDLAAADAARLPEPDSLAAVIDCVRLPRLAVAAGIDPLPLVLASLATDPLAG